MNKQITCKEKRRYPRVEKPLPIKLKDDNFDFITETQNISCIGAYCVADRYIAPMTKIRVTVLLPQNRKNDYRYINFGGVVVRVEKQDNDLENKYNIALYFNDINETNRKKLSSYVEQHLRNIS